MLAFHPPTQCKRRAHQYFVSSCILAHPIAFNRSSTRVASLGSFTHASFFHQSSSCTVHAYVIQRLPPVSYYFTAEQGGLCVRPLGGFALIAVGFGLLWRRSGGLK